MRPDAFLHALLRRAAAALPCTCALCGAAAGDVVCEPCRSRYWQAPPARCVQCALPLPAAGPAHLRCGACLAKTPAFDAAVAACDYAPPVDQLIQALKFGGRLALAPFFSRMLYRATAESGMRQMPMLLVPVPLGRRRLAERGFNQALEIARPLAAALGVRCAARLAVRVRDTRPQTLLHPDERQANLRDAFAVANGSEEMLRGAHVGIVDDVMTTGVTLGALATALKRAGAARVTCLVFARTAPK